MSEAPKIPSLSASQLRRALRARAASETARWDEAMRRQPFKVQKATAKSLDRYGVTHATRPGRIAAGKR